MIQECLGWQLGAAGPCLGGVGSELAEEKASELAEKAAPTNHKVGRLALSSWGMWKLEAEATVHGRAPDRRALWSAGWPPHRTSRRRAIGSFSI